MDQEFLNEVPVDSPVDSSLNLEEKKRNQFEDFTYKGQSELHKAAEK